MEELNGVWRKIEEVKFASLSMRDKFLKDLDETVTKSSKSDPVISELREKLKKGDLF